ncbi:MAG: isoleucine--tRNA ligase [Patescibacteria group bacterium]|jgi:isoleucyl-tRNA synthetase
MQKKHKLVSQEETTLKFWQDNNIFEKSVKKEAPKGDYVFYDGPPFATGTPHYGHIVASLMKDAVPRFWTMNGYRVERKWGWDCHGLPIENIVEKEMKVSSKRDIEEKMGVKKFNEACRGKVLMYEDVWKKFIPRMGRWVDMEHPYSTMDLSYMESIWWVFKQLWDKGLIYEGHKAMHICPRCETTLSQSEVAQGYKEVKDISLIAKFKLVDENTYVLAWTTTPWTLPGNIALAVGEKMEYLLVEEGNEKFIVAKELVEKVFAEKKYKVLKKFKGKDLVGKPYEPLFPYFDNKENRGRGFKIYAADFVSTEDGTGVVHIAPAFGEDDLNLGKKENLPWIQHVNLTGRFTKEVSDFAGEQVKPAEDPQKTDIEVLKWLAKEGKLFSKEKYTHTYPHCWRCDSPLLNYATSSWFVNVTKIKAGMISKAKKINWTPEHIKDGRFGKWLEGAADWSISRQRFWGSVMPIWKCDECKATHVFGSIKELEEHANKKISDLHKENMDVIEFKCSECDKGIMRRIPDVLDCWFESGSMPYAQMHYPFENEKKFKDTFPAEFIAEGVDQTRCWFYYLLVLSIGVVDNIPFKNVITNGIVLAEDGQKMSKRLKNYPDPNLVIDKYGADALRYYLLTSPVMKADTLLFSEKGVDEVFKKVIIILDNVVSFYKMYETKNDQTKLDSKNILDQWIIAKLHVLLSEVTNSMKAYDLVLASRPIALFVNELSTWYLRRSRNRFKGENEQDKRQALSTMKYILSTLSKILAPFTPFTAEAIYKETDGNKESVHLEEWPKADKKLINEALLSNMEKVREAVEKGLSLREEAKIKVRQPLASLEIDFKLPKEYLSLIAEEVNVLSVSCGKIYKLSTDITPELKEAGLTREIIRGINALRKKQGLTINDQVKVSYQTEDKGLKATIEKNLAEIKKNTISIDWQEKEADQEIKINSISLFVSLDKI